MSGVLCLSAYSKLLIMEEGNLVNNSFSLLSAHRLLFQRSEIDAVYVLVRDVCHPEEPQDLLLQPLLVLQSDHLELRLVLA